MSFNADDLLNSVRNEATSTQLESCPPGEYRSMIQTVAMREFKYKTGDRAGQTGISLDVTHLILDPQVEQLIGQRLAGQWNDSYLPRQG